MIRLLLEYAVYGLTFIAVIYVVWGVFAYTTMELNL